MSEELLNFFEVVSKGKKQKKQEFEELIGKNFFDENFPFTKKQKEKENNKSENEVIEQNSSFGNPTLLQKSLGLLAEPIKTNNSDPITPLNQNFATLDDLQKHYKIFIDRIQQQLSTLGGGGETNLTYMNVPVTYVTSSSYNVVPQDYYIGVNYPGAVTIKLPLSDRNGKIFIIKDELGESSRGTNRYITILPSGNDTIDNRDRAILAYDYGALKFIYRNGWRVI